MKTRSIVFTIDIQKGGDRYEKGILFGGYGIGSHFDDVN
jgi:hypothetical protein